MLNDYLRAVCCVLDSGKYLQAAKFPNIAAARYRDVLSATPVGGHVLAVVVMTHSVSIVRVCVCAVPSLQHYIPTGRSVRTEHRKKLRFCMGIDRVGVTPQSPRSFVSCLAGPWSTHKHTAVAVAEW